MPIFEQLEPRILLSADLIPLPVDADPIVTTEPLDEEIQVPLDNTDASVDPNQPLASEITTDSQSEDAIDSNSDQSQIITDVPDTESTPQELVFINDDIDGFEELRSDLEERENSEIIILSSTEDGLDQINSALSGESNISALHFFSHGNDSSIKVGSTWINSSNISDNQDSISSWGDSLSEEGDILFYGCDLAASSDGVELLNEIAELTGADVAASDDATGHLSKGGNWILEFETGEIETIVPVSSELQSDWLHILSEETISDNFDSGDYAGSSGTVDWVSDWVEIGDDNDASDGNVQISDDSLLIKPAASDDTIRGISRVADLTDAIGGSAYLSFDVDDSWGGTVTIQVRSDSDSSWGSASTYSYEHDIEFNSPDTRLRIDISAYASATTEIRFVSEESSDVSSIWSTFKVDNLNIDYTTDTWSTPLWFSTDKDVSNGGQTGIEDWDNADLIALNNSSPALGSTTDADFSMAALLSTFAEGADIRSLHYVTTKMDIGEFELNVGDLLFSADGLSADSFGDIDASDTDIIHFSPTSAGDYSSGTFSIFLDDITDKKINGLTLVETEVTVGDRTLNAGDILITYDGGEEHSDIYHLTKTETVADGSTIVTYSSSVLLEGGDGKVQIDEKITGLDLVERTTTIGNTELQAGTLLLSVDNDEDINTSGWSPLSVTNNDIFALEVTSTSSNDGSENNLGEVSASMFFDGSDIFFDSDDEAFDAFTLTVKGDIPEPTFSGAFFSSEDRTITLTGTNLDYIGEIGTNVKDQLDWSKIVWDINDDGTDTTNITFDVTNISTTIISSTEMVINLTGDKTNEITSTPGYAEDGGPDSLIITPGFSINGYGETATTDGLHTEIVTTTGPVGVNISSSNLDENTDTTGGLVIGSLSTTDADAGDTHSYEITGGTDSALFTIVGSNLILDDGVVDYESQDSYEVTIQVTDGSGQTAEETLTITVNDINEAPVIDNNSLTVYEDVPVTLTLSNLSATDPETTDSLLSFSVTSLSGGSFVYTDPDTLATTSRNSFTQEELSLGTISFLDDGNETAPSYTIEVSDGALTYSSAAVIDFHTVNDAASITSNSLTLSEDDLVTVTSSDLVINDPDTDPADLKITVKSVVGGQFELASSPGDAILNFTYQQVLDSEINFQQLGETEPAYTFELTENTTYIGESEAIITYTATNDAPTLQKNSLTIAQDSSVTITAEQLLATDPDFGDTPENLTYYITGLSNGYFTVGGSLYQTQFTQADINAGIVTFTDTNGASVPAFSVEVQDDEGASSGIHATNIHFDLNEPPTFDTSILTLDEGETVTLTGSNFSTTDTDSNVTSLSYTVVNDDSIGYFDLASNPGTPTNTFTQDDINQGKVRYVHLGGEDAPSYTITVSDGYSTVAPSSNVINFTNINDAPVISINNLTIDESGTVVISDAQLSATDIDIADESLLTFTITEKTGGYFALEATGVQTDIFTKAQIDAGDIVFVHDGGENAPDYLVTVSDGSLDSASQHPGIIFANVNDAPVLTNNSFTVTEGGQVTILSSHIGATDVDSTAANLRFRVTTDEAVGHFSYATDTNTAIDNFTQGEILAGKIIFVHKGGESIPTYLISVEDDTDPAASTTVVSGTVTVVPVNDTPELVVNNIVISEEETLQLSTSMLNATDVDSDLSDLTYQISSPQACFFAHEDNMTVAINEFSQTDLAAGKIFIIHDGSETVPECDITVSDGVATTVATAINFTFIPQNDAPTITNSATSETYTEDASKLLSGILITDVDGGTGYEVTLTLSEPLAGTLNQMSNTTATSTFTGGVLTITGTDIGDINAILAATEFTPTTNYNDDVTITINASDGITSATAASRTLHGIGVNDAPIITNSLTSESYTEDVTQLLSEISIADIDGGTSYEVTLTLSEPLAGSFNEISNTTAASSYSGGVLIITGTDINDVNAILGATKFTPSANFDDDVTITIGASDGINQASSAIRTLNGIGVNDAPLATNLNQSDTYTEDSVFDLTDIVVSDADSGEIISAEMTLASPAHGTLSTAGGASFDSTSGVWSITGTVSEVNNALSLVSFNPATDSFQDTTIAIQIEDGKEDGVTALIGTIELTGTAVADAPVVSDMETLASTPSEPIYISTNSADGAEVTHFQVTEIVNGELSLIDGLTSVEEDDFISIADGAAGLIFTPSSDGSGSFKVVGSSDGVTVASESEVSTSTITVAVPEVSSEEGGGEGRSPETGGESLGEELTTIEDVSSIDETLELVTGLETGASDADPQIEDASSPEETTKEADDASDGNSNGEEDVDDTLSYVNAQKISESSSASEQFDITAAFDSLTFDLSFDSAAVNAFSLSSATTTQTIKSESVSLLADPEENDIYATSNYDLLDLEYRDRSFEEYQSVRKSLENFREQAEQDASIEKTVVGSAIAASTGLSAGYVIWLLRSGALLSSILSSLPAWQLADPLAVLAGAKGEDEEDDDSIESILEKGVTQPPPQESSQHSLNKTTPPENNR